MTAAVVLPPVTSVLLDRRDAGRALRVTWHGADDLFVLSTWRGDVCASSFQLVRRDVPDLIAVLARGLAEPAPEPWSAAGYHQPRTSPLRRLTRRWRLR